MPQLTNLTQRQKQLADLIWNCDSQEDVQLLIRSLPTEYRKDAATVLAMIIIECIEEEIIDADHCEQAQELLLKYHS
jgi:hypothetical protein